MKAEKLCFFLLMLMFFSFSAVSCTSRGTSGIVPNEREIVLKNLSSEYVIIADAYMNLKKYDKAVEFYQKALAGNPRNKQVEYSLAGAYVFNKQYKAALKLYQHLLQSDASNTSIQLSIAYVYAQLGEIEPALNIYESLYQTETYNSTVLTNYGLLLVHQKSYEKAQSLLQELTELNPESEAVKKLEKALTEAESAAEKLLSTDTEQQDVVSD